MEDFNWMNLVWAAVPVLTAVLGGWYVGWKAKVAKDGVNDWKDEAVKAVDGLVAGLQKDAE